MKKILFSLAMIILCTCLLISCSSDKKDTEKSQNEISENALAHSGSAIYSLVRADRASKELINNITNFKNSLEAKYNVEFDIKTDWIKEGSYDDSAKEILIGDTK